MKEICQPSIEDRNNIIHDSVSTGRRTRRIGSRPSRHKEDEPAVDEDSPVIKLFRGYQHQLDKKHDKHERVVKLSRDITIESKRVIFLLHRISGCVVKLCT